jgi:hypothetical protein
VTIGLAAQYGVHPAIWLGEMLVIIPLSVVTAFVFDRGARRLTDRHRRWPFYGSAFLFLAFAVLLVRTAPASDAPEREPANGVLTDGGERPMRLVVGTKAYVKDILRDLEALPVKYALDPPYPNPSVGPVAVQLGLPQDDRVTVEIYNLLGQRIATLKDREAMSAGFHTIVWDDQRLASGM